jgi:AGCS family alanine or glycine:cation symporter
MLKYAEVYLGMQYRIRTADGRMQGGPIYFLRHAFSSPFFASCVGILLCIYGVEVFQFNIVTTSFVQNFDLPAYIVVPTLLALVLLVGSGGVRRVGKISTAIVPIFTSLYLLMGFWVLFMNINSIPGVLMDVFQSAFSGSAAAGGFIGATLMSTISQGVRRGCYTGDFGIGYASVIHSSSMETYGEKQASLVFIDTFLDTFIICTTTLLIVLTTGVWNNATPGALLVQQALSGYFPYMEFFMPLFLFLLGFSTINAYFCVGLQCAETLLPSYGRKLFFVYGAGSFLLFSLVDDYLAQSLITIVGGLLLLINSIGILRLAGRVSFAIPKDKEVEAVPVAEIAG